MLTDCSLFHYSSVCPLAVCHRVPLVSLLQVSSTIEYLYPGLSFCAQCDTHTLLVCRSTILSLTGFNMLKSMKSELCPSNRSCDMFPVLSRVEHGRKMKFLKRPVMKSLVCTLATFGLSLCMRKTSRLHSLSSLKKRVSFIFFCREALIYMPSFPPFDQEQGMSWSCEMHSVLLVHTVTLCPCQRAHCGCGRMCMLVVGS